jgi:hypothetical protein
MKTKMATSTGEKPPITTPTMAPMDLLFCELIIGGDVDGGVKAVVDVMVGSVTRK